MRASATLDDNRLPSDSLRRNNFTRRSRSIPSKLVRARQFHLLPVYWALMQSDLGREGILHSGSYRFADHIYRSEPSGRNLLGKWVDRLLLRMPATRAFRQRYVEAQRVILSAYEKHKASEAETPFRLLSIPCGIPRDLLDLGRDAAQFHPEMLSRIHYTGLDLDPQVLELATKHLIESGWKNLRLACGNALDPARYPIGPYHCVVSTGLGELLTDDELAGFYRNVHGVLADGGVFYTSATSFEPRSAKLLEAFELRAHYRSGDDLQSLLSGAPWRRLERRQDAQHLQTFVVAGK